MKKYQCEDEKARFITRECMESIIFSKDAGLTSLNMPYIEREQDVDDVIRLAGYEREYRFTYFSEFGRLRSLQSPISFKCCFNRHVKVNGKIRDLGFGSRNFCSPFGYCCVKVLDNEIFFEQCKGLMIQSMAVYPHYRKLGIGRAMIMNVMAIAGASMVHCHVLETDEDSVQFLSRCRVFDKSRSMPIFIHNVNTGRRKKSAEDGEFHPGILFTCSNGHDTLKKLHMQYKQKPVT